MKRERATEDNYGWGWGSGVKQHSITMIVRPEEFLPPLEKEGDDLLFFLIHSYESTSLNSIFGTGHNTLFKNEQ